MKDFIYIAIIFFVFITMLTFNRGKHYELLDCQDDVKFLERSIVYKDQHLAQKDTIIMYKDSTINMLTRSNAFREKLIIDLVNLTHP
jgi:hypothetical protein